MRRKQFNTDLYGAIRGVAMGWAQWAKSRGPEFTARVPNKNFFFKNNFPVAVKIRTSGYQTTIMSGNEALTETFSDADRRSTETEQKSHCPADRSCSPRVYPGEMAARMTRSPAPVLTGLDAE